MSRLLAQAAVLALLLFAAAGTMAALDFPKVGFVDMESVYKYYPGTKRVQQKMQEEQARLQADIENRRSAILAAEKSYLSNLSLMKDEEKAEAENRLAVMKRDLRVYIDDTHRKLYSLKEELNRGILQKIYYTVQKVGEDKGYTFIFRKSDKNALSTLLFWDHKFDMTKDVMERLVKDMWLEQK